MKYKVLFLCFCLVITSGCADRFHYVSIKATTDPDGVVIRTREKDNSNAPLNEADHFNLILTDEDIKKGSVDIPELVIEKPGYKKAFIFPDPIQLDKSFWFSGRKMNNGDFIYYYELPGEIRLEKAPDTVEPVVPDIADVVMSPESKAALVMEETPGPAEPVVTETADVEMSPEPEVIPDMEEAEDEAEAEVSGTAEVEVSSGTEDDPVMVEASEGVEPVPSDTADVEVNPESKAALVMEETPGPAEPVVRETADVEISPEPLAESVMAEVPDVVESLTPAAADAEIISEPEVASTQQKTPILAWTSISNKVRVEISSEPDGAEIYELGEHVCTAPCIRTYKLNNENYESGWLQINKLVGVMDGNSKEISPEIKISPEWKYHAGKTFEADYGVLFIMGTGTISSSTTYKMSGSGKECAIAKHDYMEAEAVYNSEKSIRYMHGNESAEANVGGFNTEEEPASLGLLSTTSGIESTVDHEVMNHALLRMQNAKGRISIHCGK